MKTQHTEEEFKAVELILTKPVFIGFSEETIKVRRNLLTLAFMVVVYKLSGLEINENYFSFLGIKFKNAPSNEFLDITLFFLISYHLIHFVWQSWDALKECKMRVTGTNALFMRNDITKESKEDYSLDIRQSSLLNWLWKRTKITTDDYYTMMKENSPVSTSVFDAMTEGKDHLLNKNSVTDALLNIDTLHKAITENRTSVSLRRFENFYKCFSYSQILRWSVIEFGTPVCLALFAIYQICRSYLLG